MLFVYSRIAYYFQDSVQQRKDRSKLNYYCVYIKQNPQMTVQVAAIKIVRAPFIQGVFYRSILVSLSIHLQIFRVIWPSIFRCFVRLNSRGDLYLERKFQEDYC